MIRRIVVVRGDHDWNASFLGRTLEALAVLADLRALVDPAVERAIVFLAEQQHEDGSWGEGERLFASGMLASYAARTQFAWPELLAAAGDWLAGQWSPERVEHGHWSALAAFAHFYSNNAVAGDDETDLADEALQWCGRELERGFRTRRFEAGQTLRVLLYCDAAALPGATLGAGELLAGLLDEQAGDGGFAALDPAGASGRVGPSVDALLAIPALCGAL